MYQLVVPSFQVPVVLSNQRGVEATRKLVTGVVPLGRYFWVGAVAMKPRMVMVSVMFSSLSMVGGSLLPSVVGWSGLRLGCGRSVDGQGGVGPGSCWWFCGDWWRRDGPVTAEMGWLYTGLVGWVGGG